MDQSGPRHFALISLKPPLIERPDLQSRQQRTLYGALTFVFWLFWCYLWLPLLALLAWALGVQQAFKYMVTLDGFRDLATVLLLYGLEILLLCASLILWAVYNILRFGGVENRVAAPPVTPVEIGRDFGQDAVSVAQWQREQRLCVTHDDEGRIAHVEILSAALPEPAPVPVPA